MVQLEDIHSLTDFQRNAKAHLRDMKRTGRPRVLTVNGKAELVVQDAKSYQKLLDLVDRLEAIEGVRRGLQDVAKGRTKPAQDVFERMRRKHKIAEDV